MDDLADALEADAQHVGDLVEGGPSAARGEDGAAALGACFPRGASRGGSGFLRLEDGVHDRGRYLIVLVADPSDPAYRKT